MLYSGLVSVTFRDRSPEDIIGLAIQAGLHGIEWSSRDHIGPDDAELARFVRRIMDEQGLAAPSYGTYYRAGSAENQDFEALTEIAQILGAPVLRVWAGSDRTADMTEEQRSVVMDDLRRICAIAAKKGLTVSTEYHPWTLTDTFESACRLFRELPELRTHWQADEGRAAENHPAVLQALMPKLTVVHAAWWSGGEQRPFAEGAEIWKTYIQMLKNAGQDRYVLLEFVRNGEIAQLLDDAAALNAILAY